MKQLRKLYKLLTSSNYRFNILANYGFFNHWADEKYLKRKFKSVFGYELDLDNPQTFNEKLQWLKLHDRNPLYTTLVDKYAVKQWVADKIGSQYIIPTLGVWNSPNEIDFDKLPTQFALKCNHNSGLGMCICKDKSKLDIKQVKKELEKGLKQDYYLTNREWPYKNVPRKIIAEQFMVDDKTQELRDYKFMCFNGQAKCCFVCTDRFSQQGLKVTFYDNNWQLMPFERHYARCPTSLNRPFNYDKMLNLAGKLSQNIPFVRVDFYSVKGNIYFGELTFYPGAGLEKFNPFEWDKKIGDWLILPKIR